MSMLTVILIITGLAVSAAVPSAIGDDATLLELLQRIEMMESKHATALDVMESRHAAEIQKLSVKHEDDIHRLTTRVESCEKVSVKEMNDMHTISGSNDEISTKKMQNAGHKNSKRTPTKRLYEGNNIAFSAYLDHDLNGVGTDQVVVMNQVLLNDGHGYNNITGAFIAPIDGVYSFSFFLGGRDANQIFARLTVNNIPKVDAIVQTNHGGEDAQGGNTANVKLTAGDAVMLRHTREYFNDSDHLEGSDVARLSTFSGFLIYPVEMGVQVVGK